MTPAPAIGLPGLRACRLSLARMIHRTTRATMPRPTRLRKKVSPPVPVSSGPAMSNATPAAMDSRLCRLMKPPTLTATALI